MSYVLDGERGSISVTPPALASLVVRAAAAVDGAEVRRGRRRLDVDVVDGRARVRIELSVRHGLVLSELARRVQENVGAALSTMCRVEIDAVDVSVEEVV
jgi:uncharacterized alkaline shock family protein YloU